MPNELYLPRETTEPAKGDQPAQLSQDLRQSYVHMLDAGHTLGPQDFSDAYHAAGHDPIEGLHEQLPTQETLIDSALGALRKASLPITPELVDQTKKNLSAHWAATGEDPAAVANDPIKSDAMTRRPPLKVTEEEFLTLAEHYESHGQNIKNYMFGVKNAGLAYGETGAPGKEHTASGYWQITNSTWKDTAPGAGVDIEKYPTADSAPRDVQKKVATALFRAKGPSPWTNYNPQLQAALNLPPDLQKPMPATFDPMEVVGPAEKEPADLIERRGFPSLGQALANAATKPEEPPADTEAAFGKLSEEAVAGVGKRIGQSLADIAEGVSGFSEEARKAAEHPTKLSDATDTKTAIDVALNTGGALSVIGALGKVFREMPAEKEAAQGAIRAATGQGRRMIAGATAALEPFRAQINKGAAAFKAWLDTKPGQVTPMWDENTPDIMRLIDHIESGPYTGSGGSRLAPGSPLLPVADALKKLYGDVRELIETEKPDMKSFVENYYRHLWTRPTDADAAFPGVGRVGSRASLNQRTIPTIADGIAQGLTPRILDPIENTLHYVTGMTNHLMANRVLQQGRKAGYVKYALGKPPEPGWVELKGTTKAVPLANGKAAMQTAFAPLGYASSYNAFVGRGFYEWGQTAGDIFQKVQQASNFMTAMKLGLSGYHAVVVSQATVASALANGIGKVLHGQLVSGLKDIGFGATVAPALADRYLKGKWLQKAYLQPEGNSSPFYKQLADIYANVGGRAVGRGAEYGYAQASNWVDAWHRGSLAFDIKHNFSEALKDPGVISTPVKLVGAAGHEMGRAMGSIMKPLFEVAIPRLKAGAWADEMSAWLRRNKGAAEEDILRYGRKISDTMDDRFGEMVQDNLFWPRALKQSLNVATVSVGWNYGTLRAIGTGTRDILKGNILSPRARLLISYPVAMGIIGSMYQYFKTGMIGPSVDTPGSDIRSPRTGGTTPYGDPERALLPGEQKEPLQWFHAMQSAPNFLDYPHQIAGIAGNKLSPLAGMLPGVLSNKDWRGDPYFSNVPDPGEMEPPPQWKQLGRYVLEHFEPIGLETMGNRKVGTNISHFEQSMGVRPAPAWMQNPERDKANRQRAEQRQIKEIQKQRARDAAQQEK